MKKKEYQDFWVPGGATLRLPPRMRLARAERERLWRGLERFVNCSDSESDYRALGRAFPAFWPVEIQHFPLQEPVSSKNLGIRAIAAPIFPLSDAELDLEIEESLRLSETVALDWHLACHRLFLFYRDTLKDIWNGKEETDWFCGGKEEFLLGLSDRNEEAWKIAKENSFPIPPSCIPFELFESWQEILGRFSTAWAEGRREIKVLWSYGDFAFVPGNDFERGFYLLFRQSWRARACPRCKMLFVARRPKQTFCGTVCSAGSRLASKRKWWRSVGAKRRTSQNRKLPPRNQIERKHQ